MITQYKEKLILTFIPSGLYLFICIWIPKIHMQLRASTFFYFISLLFQLLVSFMQFFSIDNAITEVATSDSPPLQLIAEEFIKQCLKKGYIWKKNNYSLHSLLLIRVVSRRRIIDS